MILYEIGGRQVSWNWHKRRARGTAFSPDGKLAASGSDDGTVSLVERPSGKQLHVFQVGRDAALNVAFSRDGKTLAATTWGASQLWTWDLADVKKITALSGHKAHVMGLSLHPAGRLAATGSGDGTVRVWDLPTGRSWVFHCGGWAGRVDAVAFTPEGRYLVAGSVSGVVWIWKTPSFPAPKAGESTLGPIDLLKHADLKRDTLKGTWKRQKTGLVASGQAILELPYRPPTEYDFLVEFTPQRHAGPCGSQGAGVIFPYAQDRTGSVSWFLDQSGQLCHGWRRDRVKHTNGTGVRFQPGEKYQFRVRVRKDRVTFAIDGRDTHIFWSAGEKVGPDERFLRDNSLPGLMCYTERV